MWYISLSEAPILADSAIPTTTGEEYLSTTTVATMNCMMIPIVTESSIHQTPQSSANSPNDLDMIHSESATSAESVPIATIHNKSPLIAGVF
ncbi:hypothetical protein BASA61_000063 [Batrachochytrium salamandrivorans]|nr:hypothetical protein BASA61_000063 [Batrachochytrium salamandrivorans]